jgi:hypothetical protein
MSAVGRNRALSQEFRLEYRADQHWRHWQFTTVRFEQVIELIHFHSRSLEVPKQMKQPRP